MHHTKRSPLILVLLLITAALLLPASAFAQNALHGAWRITEVSFTSADTSYTDTNPQPGLYMFTDQHYSTVLVPGPERELFSDQTSEAERLAAYENFVANAGTYEASGTTLTMQHMVAKFPNVMSGTLLYTYQIEGDMLRLTLTGGWADEGEIRYTLARVE